MVKIEYNKTCSRAYQGMLVSFYLNRMRLIQQAYGTGKAHMCRMAAIETIGSILDGNELETSLLARDAQPDMAAK